MKFVIAPDSFKESLEAITAAETITAGMRRVLPDAQYELMPMADGGEGTVEAIVRAHKGKFAEAEVLGPLSRRVTARYGVIDSGRNDQLWRRRAHFCGAGPVLREDHRGARRIGDQRRWRGHGPGSGRAFSGRSRRGNGNTPHGRHAVRDRGDRYQRRRSTLVSGSLRGRLRRR